MAEECSYSVRAVSQIEGDMAELEQRDLVSKERRKRAFAHVGVIAIAMVASVVLWMVYAAGWLPFDEDREYSHSYSLKIITDTDEGYTLMVPVPLNKTGAQYAGFIDELTVTLGEVDISVVDTLHGKALEVTGSGNATLEWDSRWSAEDEGWYLNISMTSGNPFDHDNDTRSSWIYSDQGGLSVRFSFSAQQTYNETPTFPSGGGPSYSLMDGEGDYTLDTQVGWQETVLECYWEAIN